MWWISIEMHFQRALKRGTVGELMRQKDRVRLCIVI